MRVTHAQLRSLRELSSARTERQRARWWARISLITLRSLRDRKLIDGPVITQLGRAVLAGANARRSR